MSVPADGPDPGFARTIERAHPAVGRAWLGDLRAVQDRLATQWNVTLTAWLPARGACVLEAVTGDGEPAVVKIPVIADDTASEGRALAYWDGDGGPRLLAADAVTGALLIAWVDGRPFAEEPDTTRTLRRAGDYLRALHRPRQVRRPALPTLEEKLAPWRRSREQAERSHGAPQLVDGALRGEAAVRAWLAESASATAIIHGDLHPRNLLAASDGALCAIDPYGVVGDPCRDAASLALFFREDSSALDRLEALAGFAEVEPDRVVAHAYALAAGAYRFRVAYGVAAGTAFLEQVAGDLRRRLSGVVEW